MKDLVVLTGAGMSADSGLNTFRDSDGLWEGYDVMDVATPEGWHRDPSKVLDFYNKRRAQAWHAIPNDGHKVLFRLESRFRVTIVTQNVDNLHEKAGSGNVIHLHGMLKNVRSTGNPRLIYDYEDRPIHLGDICEEGHQLRPDIVWFGEEVPMIHYAAEIASRASIFVIIGTSLVVYPAAGLLTLLRKKVPIFLVDPAEPQSQIKRPYHHIKKRSAVGTPELVDILMNENP